MRVPQANCVLLELAPTALAVLKIRQRGDGEHTGALDQYGFADRMEGW